jgi:hypothetical protein
LPKPTSWQLAKALKSTSAQVVLYVVSHKQPRNKFITAGKKLQSKTLESVTKFFEAQFTTNKNNGMLECMELKLIKKRAHLKLKNKLYNKICTHKNKPCTYRAKRKIASHDAQRHPYDNRKEQCWYIDRNCDHDCAYDNKHLAEKHPRIEHSGNHDRKDNCCDNQPKKLGYEKPKSKGKVLCPNHSTLDKLAKHSWADCSENQENQKKPALRSMVNAHHAAIDNRYLRNDDSSPMESDHMEAANNQSLGRCLSSNYDNAFVTSKLLPPLPARKRQRRLKAATSRPRIRGRPLLPLMMMTRTWHTPSLSWLWPKASKSPWLSFRKAINGTHQWTVLHIR